MSEIPRWLSHRQIVSGLVSLVIGGGFSGRPILGDLGYSLQGIELSFEDGFGHHFEPDLLLLNATENLSIVVECKSGPDSIRAKQTASYFSMDGRSIVTQGRLTLSAPRQHCVDAGFFVVESATGPIVNEIQDIVAHGAMQVSGYGVTQILETSISCPLNRLSDPRLSASFIEPWTMRFDDLPLERLPFESSSPDWELAQAILQTLSVYFLSNRDAFTVEDVCQNCHELWTFLSDKQPVIRTRVQRMVQRLRGTAFKGWLVQNAPTSASAERTWRFKSRATDRTIVQIAFQLRARRFVDLLRAGHDPKPADFDNIDQLAFPNPFPPTPLPD